MYSYIPKNPDSSTNSSPWPVYSYKALRSVKPADFITQNAEVLHLLAQADRVADSAATVLIMGESGTGKEILAQRLHQRCPRRGASFVRLNCASIAPRCPKACSRASFLAMKKALLQAPCANIRVALSRRMGALYFSMRSARLIFGCNCVYCACCKSASSSGSGARRP